MLLIFKLSVPSDCIQSSMSNTRNVEIKQAASNVVEGEGSKSSSSPDNSDNTGLFEEQKQIGSDPVDTNNNKESSSSSRIAASIKAPIKLAKSVVVNKTRDDYRWEELQSIEKKRRAILQWTEQSFFKCWCIGMVPC